MVNSEIELSYNISKYKQQLSRRIYKMILNSINYEYIKPGIKIDIMKLAKNIGVKKTPVTDALNLLSDYGFLEKSDYKDEYYTISEYSEEIIQVYYARSILESNAAFLCAKQLNFSNKENVIILAETFEKFDDVEIMKEVDFEFHNLIVNSCGNEYIIQFYNLLTEKIKHYMMSNIEHIFKSGKDLNFSPNHIKIANAIIMNEPILAEKEMKDHIDEAFIDAIFNSMIINNKEYGVNKDLAVINNKI